ncbi:uncharacterized protein LOC144119874 [Amblyomma americanum]
MTPEHVACHYLTVEVLTVVLLLFPLVVIDGWSELVRSLAQGICARFGLRRGPLFAVVCTCAFVSAFLFSGIVTSVAILYFVDRVLFAIFSEDMDRTPDVLPYGILRSTQQETASMQSAHFGDQVLFDRLAQVVLTMKKPQRRFMRRKKKADAPAPPLAAPCATPAPDAKELATVSESPKEDVERTEAESTIKTKGKGGRLSRWRQKWFKKQATADAQHDLQPTTQVPANPEEGLSNKHEKLQEERAKETYDTAPTQPGPAAVPSDPASHVVLEAGLVRVMLSSKEDALNVMKPISPASKEGGLKPQETKHVPQDPCLENQQEQQPGSLAGSNLALSQPFVPAMSVQSPTEASLTKQHQGKLIASFNLFPWRHDPNRDTKAALSATSPTAKKARPSWFRRISVFSGKVAYSAQAANPAAVIGEQVGAATQLQPANDISRAVAATAADRIENTAETESNLSSARSVLPVEDGATEGSLCKSKRSITAADAKTAFIPDATSSELQLKTADASRLSGSRSSGTSFLTAKPDLEPSFSKASTRDTDLESVIGKPTTQAITFTGAEVDSRVSKEAGNKIDKSCRKRTAKGQRHWRFG